MDWMAQSRERGLPKAFALGWVGMNCRGDVLKPRAHLERQTEPGRQFRNAGSNTLDAEQQMIVGSGDDADKAIFPLQSHGAAVCPERKEAGLEVDTGGLGLVG